ncbi:hypothetical protein KKE26_01555 [bacterium]|nr:hypothetical protein [bacterium]MBU1754547.1 hypothetical protein [bacterium]
MEKQINITHEVDIAIATSEAIVLAEAIGFKQAEQYMVATAVSELARNIFRYAIKGNSKQFTQPLLISSSYR